MHAAFPRKIFELLFDGRDEAREDLDMGLDEAKAWRKEINKRFDLSPGKAFFEPFVGRYRHPLYGEFKVSFDATKGAWLDVGAWRSLLGKKKEEDGTEKLVTTSAPWLDWPEFVRKERDGKPVLEFQDGQRKVILERVP